MTIQKKLCENGWTQVAGKVLESTLSGWTLNVAIHDTLDITVEISFRRRFNPVNRTSQLCGCVTQRLN